MRGPALLAVVAGLTAVVAACDRGAPAISAPTQPRFVSKVKLPKGKLKLDQSNTVSDQLGLGNGLYGQTFVPQSDNLAVVELLLIVNQVPAEGAVATLGLYRDITGEPIAYVAGTIAGAAPGELERTVSYRFEPPVPLEKGTTYTLGWQGPATASWEFAYGDPYPQGQVVLYNGTALNPPGDFVFATYAEK